MSSIKKMNEELLGEEGFELSVRGKYFEYQIEGDDGILIEFDCRLPKGAMYNLLSKKGLEGFLESEGVEVVSEEQIEGGEEKEEEDIFADFATLDAYIEMCLSTKDDFKNINSILVSGASGISKTYHVIQALEKAKVEAFHIKGYSTAYTLFEILKMDPNGVYVFDDCDSIWKDETGLNILKAALETTKNGVRKITWASGGDIEVVEFTGKIFFISNMDFFAKNTRLPHIKAVIGRTMTVAICSKRDQLIKYIASEAENVSSDKKAVKMATNYMENKTKVRPDFRYFMKLIALAKYAGYNEDKFDAMAKSTSKIQKLAS